MRESIHLPPLQSAPHSSFHNLMRRGPANAQQFASRTHTRAGQQHVHGKPKFRNAAQQDYRLAPDSPGLNWTSYG